MHDCAYAYVVECEWDGEKASANLRKHGVDFADAATVLHDEMAITIQDDSGQEPRSVTVGASATGAVLVLVYTWRRDRVRLISARPATKRERGQYEEKR